MPHSWHLSVLCRSAPPCGLSTIGLLSVTFAAKRILRVAGLRRADSLEQRIRVAVLAQIADCVR